MKKKSKSETTKATSEPLRSNGKDDLYTSTSITTAEYGRWVVAFNHFNDELCDGQLPEPLIVYQRRAHVRGHFWADALCSRIDASKKPELALNLDAFVDRSDMQIASTLAHEMMHLKQYCFGKPSARGYHNRQWAQYMKEIGLQPTSTGAAGGKETGQRVTHLVVPGGRFEQAFIKLEKSGWRLDLQSSIRGSDNKKRSDAKTTYICATCDVTCFGRPDLHLICGDCDIKLQVKPVGSIEP